MTESDSLAGRTFSHLMPFDPGLAVSLVITGVDSTPEDVATDNDLLGRTIALALLQSPRPNTRSQRKASIVETALYSDDHAGGANRVLPFQENASGNPIVSLDCSSRIAFVLHHVLGYSRTKSVSFDQASEESRAHLRNA